MSGSRTARWGTAFQSCDRNSDQQTDIESESGKPETSLSRSSPYSFSFPRNSEKSGNRAPEDRRNPPCATPCLVFIFAVLKGGWGAKYEPLLRSPCRCILWVYLPSTCVEKSRITNFNITCADGSRSNTTDPTPLIEIRAGNGNNVKVFHSSKVLLCRASALFADALRDISSDHLDLPNADPTSVELFIN